MKNSLDMLKAYSNMIVEAEQSQSTFNANDFVDGKNQSKPISDEEVSTNDTDEFGAGEEDDNSIESNNPIEELATYIDNYSADSDANVGEIIEQFLKEHNYQIVPINGLENSTGNV